MYFICLTIDVQLWKAAFPFPLNNPVMIKKTLAAMQEARDILSGKIQTKSYDSPEDLLEDLNKK